MNRSLHVAAVLSFVVIVFVVVRVRFDPAPVLPPPPPECDEIQNGGSIPFRVLNCAGSIPQTVYWTSGVENDIRTLFERIRPTRVFDIGCNQGYYSLLSASMGADTYCFEMQPKCLELVYKQREMNRVDFTVLEVALGSHEGMVSTHDGACEGGHTYDSKSGTVRLRRFNDLFLPTPTDIVKIDTEGSEIDILKGMTGFQSEHWIIEFAPARWSEKGITLEEGAEVVRTFFANYDVFVLDDVYEDVAWNPMPELKSELLKGMVIYEAPKNWLTFFRNRGKRGTNVLFKHRAYRG